MKMVGILITACVVLAAAQAAMAVLAVLVLAALIYGLFKAPAETIGFVGLLVFAGMFRAHPLVFLGIALIGLLGSAIRRAA